MADMASGELFTVTPGTGYATLIDLGGVQLHGDGLVNKETWLRNLPFSAWGEGCCTMPKSASGARRNKEAAVVGEGIK